MILKLRVKIANRLVKKSFLWCYKYDKETYTKKGISSFETSTTARVIESTLTESGIGIPIIHDKYDYCHGKSTLSHNYNGHLILLSTNSEIDEIYKRIAKNYYNDEIILDKKCDDDIINDFYFTYLSMFLCKKIAEIKKMDLSLVNYSSIVKKLYYFKEKL